MSLFESDRILDEEIYLPSKKYLKRGIARRSANFGFRSEGSALRTLDANSVHKMMKSAREKA